MLFSFLPHTHVSKKRRLTGAPFHVDDWQRLYGGYVEEQIRLSAHVSCDSSMKVELELYELSIGHLEFVLSSCAVHCPLLHMSTSSRSISKGQKDSACVCIITCVCPFDDGWLDGET